MNLNLGSGYRPREDCINLDIRYEVRPDIVCDARNPLPFKSNSFKRVYAYDFLEHIPIGFTVQVMEEQFTMVIKTVLDVLLLR